MGSQPFSSTCPLSLTADTQLLVEPDTVLTARPSMDSSSPSLDILIRWQDLPAHEDSEEPFEVIQVQFPHLNLRTSFVLGWPIMVGQKSKSHMQGGRKE